MKRFATFLALNAALVGAAWAQTPPANMNIPGVGQNDPNGQPGQFPASPWSGGLSFNVVSGIHLTIYGIVDVGVGNAKVADANLNSPFANPVAATGATAGGVSESFIASGQGSGSRLGFSGSGKVSDDLYFVFVAEQRLEYNSAGNGGVGFNGPVTGTGNGLRTWDRQIYGGLVNPKYGFLGLGRQYTPRADLISSTDLLGGGYTASMNNIAPPMNTNRMSNSVKWVSPLWNGFTARAQYAFGGSTLAPAGSSTNVEPPNTTGNTAVSDANTVRTSGDKGMSFSLSYETPKLIVGFSYLGSYAGTGSGNPSLPGQTQNATAAAPIYINFVPVGSVTGFGAGAGTVTSINSAYHSGQAFERWNTFHLLYDFDLFKVSVIYSNVKNLVSKNFTNSTWTGSTTAAAGASNAIQAHGDRSMLSLGASVPVDGHNKVYVGFSHFDDQSEFAQDNNQYTTIYEHAFPDKKTTAYVLYSYIQNKNSATWGFGGGGIAPTNLSSIGGQNGSDIGTGIKYIF
ncbi:MAG: porin [Holophaga sp.]|nr:porin [Holophaga sp.]